MRFFDNFFKGNVCDVIIDFNIVIDDDGIKIINFSRFNSYFSCSNFFIDFLRNFKKYLYGVQHKINNHIDNKIAPYIIKI